MVKRQKFSSSRRWMAIASLCHFFLSLFFVVLMADAAVAANPPLMVTPGQFGVSSTGAATYNIPIAVPPGTSGVVPSLSLSYSSQNGDGIVGYGWTLNGLSSITRCPRTLAQDTVHGSVNYQSGDRFCLDGQRLMVVSGIYGADGSEYRTEIESFSKIVAHGSSGSGPAWFEVHTKAGQIMEFGNTSDSAVLVISAGTSSIPSGTIREWVVNKISDVVGNYMTVTYTCTPLGGSCTSGEAYPSHIDYTGNASASKPTYNHVDFAYASRSDSAPMYQAGGVVTPIAVLTDIKTYIGTSTLIQDYRLTYRAGTSTLRSHLTSLTQCDGSGTCPSPCAGSVHCHPTITFNWQETTSTNVSSVPSSIITGPDQVVAADFNGDGLTDQTLILNCGSASYPVYLGQPSFGFVSGTAMPNPMPSGAWPACSNPPSVLGTILAPDGTAMVAMGIHGFTTSVPVTSQNYIALWSTAGSIDFSSHTSSSLGANIVAGDLNGDGITDFLEPLSSTGYGFIQYPLGTFTQDSGVSIATVFLNGGDFDGDGCTDIMSLALMGATPASITYAYLHCNPAINTVTPPMVSGATTTTGDFNGDGKTDIAFSGSIGTGQIWLSTGTGFVQTASDSLPSNSTIESVGDWNGDGKADVVADNKLYLSTGSDFTPALDSMGNQVTLSYAVRAVADWDNNGNSDILVGNSSYAEYELIDYMPELMTSVSNGIGSTTFITYDRINQNSSFYQKCSTSGVFVCDSYPTQAMDGPQYVVKEVDASDGLGTCNPATGYSNCYRTTYSYTEAKKDLQGRGFLGFKTVSVSDLQTNIVQTTTYCLNFPLIGLVSTDVRVHSGTTLSSVTNYYNGNNSSVCTATPNSGVNNVKLTKSVVLGNDLDGSPLPTTTTTYTYDSYNNPLTVNIGVSDGSSKNTTNTYSNDTTNWFLGRLLTTSVNSIVGSSNMARQSSFAYDSSTGLLTQESIEPGVSTCNAGSDSCTLTTSYTYDLFGHRITTTVYGTGITTRTSYAFYESNGRFMTSAANALGQYEFWEYDPDFGNPTKHTGPNFLATTWSYDAFGRLTQEVRPDGTHTDTSYAYCSGGCPTYGQFYSQSDIKGPSGGGSPQVGPTSYVYFDMLSRAIANDGQGFDGRTIRVATIYDVNGRVHQTSRPYFSGDAPAWTQFAYDDLGRVTQATFPDSSHITYGFNGLTTTVTNNLSQTTTTVKNSQGLNATVTDATSHSTSYVYDAFEDLLTVTDPNSNVISNTFDLRGNKVTSHDPDMGNWTYSYDVLAELTSQTDAKSQITSLTYDVLGRPLTRTENGLYSAWTYGNSASNRNVGQVVEAKACPTSACSTIVSDKTYFFDGMGRESQYFLQTPTDYFGYATTYNSSNGQIASVKYPSGYTVYRNYNPRGFLTKLTEAGNAPVWTINARNAELHITSQTAGGGAITTAQGYDHDTGLLRTIRTSGGSVASFTYDYDTIGNLIYRDDPNGAYAEIFCYDSLNRVTNYNFGAACTGTGGTTVNYDAIGNITTKSDTGTYTYPSSGSSSVRPHAVSAISGTADGLFNPQYSYDANGNLTCVSSAASCGGAIARQVTMTSFNMAATLIQASTSLSLIYDDLHQRLQQTSTTAGSVTTTVYVNDAASGAMSERKTDPISNIPTFTDYITIDGQIVAQRSVQNSGSPPWTQTPAGCTSSNLSPCVPPLWQSFYWGDADATRLTKTWNGFTWGASTFGWSPQAWNNFKWEPAGNANAVPWSGTAIVKWAFFTLDNLGSVAVITDQGGNVVQRLSYDAWGKPRGQSGGVSDCGTITSSTTKGYTNQEMVPTQCLVNLNARLYDASIGKFMVADSIVPDPYNGQSFNRYSYVANNPLSFTDPTGHDVEQVFDTGFRGSGFTFSPDAAIFGSSTGGLGFFGADLFQPNNTATSQTSLFNVNQKDQANNPNRNTGNTCSRTGWTGCGGSDWLKNGFAGPENNRSRSRGEETEANADAHGDKGSASDCKDGCLIQVAANTGGKLPNIIGSAGAEKLREDLIRRGYVIVDEQAEVQTKGGIRVYDFLVRPPGGGNLVGVDEQNDLLGVEAKTTTTGNVGLKRSQVLKDEAVVEYGGRSDHGIVTGVLYGIILNQPVYQIRPDTLRGILKQLDVPFIVTPLGIIEKRRR